MDIACPHCGANNPGGSSFCEKCGKALPSAMPSGPRVLTGDAAPQSLAGQQMLSDQLGKQTKRAANALLAVGILMAVVTVVFGLILYNSGMRVPQSTIITVVVIQGLVSLLFFGLYVWARRSPLPAAIAGLCVYGTLVVINVVSAAAQMGQEGGGRSGGFGGLGIGCMDIIIIGVLIQGIQAGIKHRKLQAGGQ
jgi:hypothetical protein